MEAPQTAMLPDGRRLHLHHGPIDLIVDAKGAGREAALRQATQRFQTILQELVDELPLLRMPATAGSVPLGRTARRMHAAAVPFLPLFVTPMAAVAGAVADEILAAMMAGTSLTKAYVNNGGDAAFHLAPGEEMRAAIAAPLLGGIVVPAVERHRGVATSGWRGRSHSLGIADSVSVLAATGAAADAAATLVANAVDLPGHPAIERTPARLLAPDSDLGERLVTTSVGRLTHAEVGEALERGAEFARALLARDLIGGAVLMLNGEWIATGAIEAMLTAPRE